MISSSTSLHSWSFIIHQFLKFEHSLKFIYNPEVSTQGTFHVHVHEQSSKKIWVLGSQLISNKAVLSLISALMNKSL